MDSLDFLEAYPKGDATLSVRYVNGSLVHIAGLDHSVIETASPLLAFAFEETRSGPRHYMEDVTPAAISSLLRYIYSEPREYVPEDYRNSPISMLVHAHVYHLAETYDIPDLRRSAKGNITRECEFSCSACMPPLDLCEAIEYIYQYLPTHKDIIDTLSNYCVSMFLYHKLGQMQAFKDLCYVNDRFQQDLCMVNINRGFIDDAALAIIQLPVKPSSAGNFHRRNPVEGRILQDVLYDLWSVTGDENDEVGSNRRPQESALFRWEKADRQDHLPFTRRALPYRQHARPERTVLSHSTRKEIEETFTAGILSLPPDEISPWLPYAHKRLDLDQVKRHVPIPTHVDVEISPTHPQYPMSFQEEPRVPAQQEADRADDQAALQRRLIALKYAVKSDHGQMSEARDASRHTQLPLRVVNRTDFVDESLTDAGDADDGFVHVNADSDSEWTVV